MEGALLNEDYNDALTELDDCKQEALSMLEQIELQEAFLKLMHTKGKLSDLLYEIEMVPVRRLYHKAYKVLKMIQSERTKILYEQYMQ